MRKFSDWLFEVESLADKIRIEYDNYTIRKKGVTLPALLLNAYLDDKFVGDLELVQDGGEWTAYGVRVLPDYQRRRVATAMYDYAEKLLGVKLKPSSSQSDDGIAFWQQRLKR